MKSFLFSLVLIAVLAGKSQSQNIILSPDKVPGGMPFQISILHFPQGCENFDYTDTSARISNDTLYLNYVKRISLLPFCRVDAYGPKIDVPALQGPAVYTVMGQEIPACTVGPGPICGETPPPPYFAGLLNVTGPSAAPIWLNPNRALASRAFNLVVKSREFLCNDMFGSPRVGIAGASLVVTFNYSQSRIMCPVPDTAVKTVSILIPDPGLAFRLDGKYAVYWNPDTAVCRSNSLACSTQFQSAPFDTLFLYAPTPVMPGRKNRNSLRWDGPFPMGTVRGFDVDGRKAKRFFE